MLAAPIVLIIALVTAIVIVVGAFVLTIAGLLVWPGRKGKMRTTREFVIPQMSQADAWKLMVDRLQYEGFEIQGDAASGVLEGRRPARHYQEGEHRIVTHATKALQAEGEFLQSGPDVSVRLTLWMDDFVLLDSGEGRQIDLMLERLITAELDKVPSPAVPSVSMNAMIGAACGVVTIAAGGLPAWWASLRDRWLVGYAAGVVFAGMMTWGMAGMAIRDIRSRPAEVQGRALAFACCGLAVLGIGIGAAWLVWRIMAWR